MFRIFVIFFIVGFICAVIISPSSGPVGTPVAGAVVEVEKVIEGEVDVMSSSTGDGGEELVSIEFKDGRRKEFRNPKSIPIPSGKYMIFKYNHKEVLTQVLVKE